MWASNLSLQFTKDYNDHKRSQKIFCKPKFKKGSKERKFKVPRWLTRTGYLCWATAITWSFITLLKWQRRSKINYQNPHNIFTLLKWAKRIQKHLYQLSFKSVSCFLPLEFSALIVQNKLWKVLWFSYQSQFTCAKKITW